MNSIQLVTLLTNDGILYSLGGSLAFLTAVLIFDPKLRKSAVGKSLIVLDVGLSALYIPPVLHRFFGLEISEIGFAWYYFATILLVGSTSWWRTILMVMAQLRKGRRRPGPVTPAAETRPETTAAPELRGLSDGAAGSVPA